MTLSSFIYAILAGILPSLIWLFFWLREDTHKEPRGVIAGTFIVGMLTVLIAVFVEKYIETLVPDVSIKYTLWAATEEILKFMAVAIIALPNPANRDPVDAMIYCVAAALGFAALENTFFIMGPLHNGEIAKSILTGNMRFIGASLVHIVSSACVGFTLGYTFYHGRFAKLVAIIIGLAGAIAIHAAFNISIIAANSGDALKSFAWIWGAVVLLIILFEEVKAVKPRFGATPMPDQAEAISANTGNWIKK